MHARMLVDLLLHLAQIATLTSEILRKIAAFCRNDRHGIPSHENRKPCRASASQIRVLFHGDRGDLQPLLQPGSAARV
ncbi:hypothetical protein V8F20_010802 [Naviculisporaceae sp. PSN 640]